MVEKSRLQGSMPVYICGPVKKTYSTTYHVLDARTRLLPRRCPWPATKDELIDFAMRTGAPLEVVENLQAIEDDEEVFESIEEIWPDYPSKEDFFFNEDEY
jgi:hypothetical protein